ncbi:DUF2232 domain-containing protein [Geothermobacter hydrogeniphilus]|uniref:DUF2232 domain-containing protein n=1 Tax=Geothermobacter hydrogeniphilus TaxID=1969733 RepID=A0A1X0YD44_9BACT|nr:DUF2232 domain-containing protein [Geothermobacter hydrogeniphilus]ORJ63022.1 hypothetical protein B5V00_02945 [Geothermobacter hydrogeniphilus]
MKRDNLRFLLIGTLGSLLLQLLAGQFGVLGMLLSFLVPVPLAYVAMRRGMLIGCGSALLACGGMQMLGGLSAMFAFAAQFALPAMIVAGLLRQGVPWDRVLLYGTLGLVSLASVTLLIYSQQSGVSLPSMVDQYLQGEVTSALKLADQGNLNAEQAESFRSAIQQMGTFLKGTFPAWIALVTAIMLGLQVVFLGRLARGEYRIPGAPLSGWKAPEILIWPLILAGFGVVFGEGAVRLVALNGLVLLLPIYFLQGLAVVSFFFGRKEIPSFIRGFGYLLIAVLNPLPIIVTGIGVFDMWADFRKPRQKKSD